MLVMFAAVAVPVAPVAAAPPGPSKDRSQPEGATPSALGVGSTSLTRLSCAVRTVLVMVHSTTSPAASVTVPTVVSPEPVTTVPVPVPVVVPVQATAVSYCSRSSPLLVESVSVRSKVPAVTRSVAPVAPVRVLVGSLWSVASSAHAVFSGTMVPAATPPSTTSLKSVRRAARVSLVKVQTTSSPSATVTCAGRLTGAARSRIVPVLSVQTSEARS